MNKIAIFGCSGFASEIVDICDALQIEEVLFLSEKELLSNNINGISVVSEKHVYRLVEEGFKFSIGVAEPSLRKKISQKYTGLTFVNLIHPSVTFGRLQRDNIAKCQGLTIAAGARFMSGIDIGDFVVVSLNATIGHDCRIESFVSVMPGANVSGNVWLGEEVFIGSGAVILQGSEQEKLYLSKSLIVGAGAVVTKSFSDAGVVVGVPARVVKDEKE